MIGFGGITRPDAPAMAVPAWFGWWPGPFGRSWLIDAMHLGSGASMIARRWFGRASRPTGHVGGLPTSHHVREPLALALLMAAQDGRSSCASHPLRGSPRVIWRCAAVVMLGPDGRYADADETALELLGVASVDELRATDPAVFQAVPPDPDEVDAMQRAFAEAIFEGVLAEGALRRRDGELVRVRTAVIPLPGGGYRALLCPPSRPVPAAVPPQAGRHAIGGRGASVSETGSAPGLATPDSRRPGCGSARSFSRRAQRRRAGSR